MAKLRKTVGYAGLEVPPPGHRAELESSREGVPFAEGAELTVSVTGSRRLWLDITHPIPDLTGFITEGQIVLSRSLDARGVYPPVDVLMSLSRLMKDSIGEGYTREDHPSVASQVFASYSRVQEIKALAGIVGEDELGKTDRACLEFGRRFEKQFITQGPEENRTIEQSLDLCWQLLSTLPETELTRVSRQEIKEHMKKK